VAGTWSNRRRKMSFAFPPHAFAIRINSIRSTRRSPVSTFATQLGDTSNRVARARWVNPALSRATRSSLQSAAYSDVWIVFFIAPMIEASYYASNLEALLRRYFGIDYAPGI